METRTIESEIFRISPTTYLQATAGSIMPRLWLFAGLPLLACLIAAVWEPKMLFVALILLFLIIPMAVFHIYFMRLLTPEARFAVTPKHVTISPDAAITVTFHTADEENTPQGCETIAAGSIKSWRITRKHIIAAVSGRKTPLIIPLEALPAIADPHKMMQEICPLKGDDSWQDE